MPLCESPCYLSPTEAGSATTGMERVTLKVHV